ASGGDAGACGAGTSVAVAGEGVHTIAYRSTDAAGNAEADGAATVRIDTQAPVTSDDAPAGWSNHAVTVTLTATDAGAGVASTEYNLDGAGAGNTGSDVVVPGTGGTHPLT